MIAHTDPAGFTFGIIIGIAIAIMLAGIIGGALKDHRANKP